MNVFEKRPLSLILCIMLGGFSLFINSTTAIRLALTIVAIVLAFCSSSFKKLFLGRIVLFRLACSALALSLMLAELFVFCYVPHKYIDKTVKIYADVSNVDQGDFSTSVALKCRSINGNHATETVLLQDDNAMLYGITLGDRVFVEGILEAFEESDDGFDERSYYFSRGFSARITDVENITLISDKGQDGIPILTRMQLATTERLKLATNEHTGGFLAALIMGDKSSLDSNTSLNYSLIGISHILALSGMHLVIISEMLRRILSGMRLNKKTILIISTAFCLFYMGVTGFSASVVRSAVMLTITNGLFLVTGTHDSYTTLPLSVVLILLVQPYAVFDISLWLSALATLGVLVYAEFERKSEEKKRGLLSSMLVAIRQSVFATIFAVGAAYPIMMMFFNSGSLLAPITTMIFSFPINFLIFAGFAVLVFYPILPLGVPVIYITDAINEAVEFVASAKWATYSTEYPAVRALIIAFSVLFYAYIILKVDRKRAMVAVLITLFMSVSVVGVISSQIERHTDEMSFIDSGYSDIMLTKWDGNVTLIRTGGHSKRAAYSDITVVKDRRICYVDNLILTSYNGGAVTYADTFFKKMKTNTLYLPKPKNAEELEIAENMAQLLSLYGTNMRFYESEKPIDIGKCEYYHLASEAYEYGDNTASAYTILYRGEFYTYLSAGMIDYDISFSRKISYSSEHLIFGAHGDVSYVDTSFGLTSPKIKEIYYDGILPLATASKTYYEEKEVPITRIDTSYNLYIE